MEIKVINYINLDKDKLCEVLRWRNENRVWFCNSNIIALKDHFSFVERLKKDANNIYYAVILNTENGQYGAGVIHFNDIENNQAEVGLFKDQKSTMEKTGSILMELICIIAKQMKLKRLELNVFKNNKIAIALYKKYGFALFDEDEHSYLMERYLS
jgi:UDP-4-amino-4,6-dideoxy-N-acetyl-beta-L-altrosamine N-acetyltransferase